MKNKIIRIGILILVLIFAIGLSFSIGIDFSVKTLILIMCIDYSLGLSLAITGNSKHGNGTLSSKIGYKGLVRKITILLLVGLGSIIDNYLLQNGIDFAYIKDVAVTGFILNEIISIIENAQLIGLKLPSIFSKLVEVLENLKSNKNKK